MIQPRKQLPRSLNNVTQVCSVKFRISRCLTPRIVSGDPMAGIPGVRHGSSLVASAYPRLRTGIDCLERVTRHLVQSAAGKPPISRHIGPIWTTFGPGFAQGRRTPGRGNSKSPL
jgi:hypothetical protein